MSKKLRLNFFDRVKVFTLIISKIRNFPRYTLWSVYHDTHTAVLINTAVLILHCRTIYQKKKPTGAIIPMSFSSCFPHATYHLHFTIFVFSTHKNSKNIKTGWNSNIIKLLASAAFFVFLWAKIGSVE